MTHWTYIIPRIIILGLIALAVWIGADPLTRMMIVNSLESANGAKVEVSQLRLSFKDKKLFLKDLEIANASDPMSNLAQADMVYVELDTEQLLHRQVVITSGQTSRLMFGTPRTSDGSLPDSPTKSKIPFEQKTIAAPSAEEIGQRWLDQLEPTPTATSSIENQHLFAAAKELSTSWSNRLDQIQTQVDAIKTRTDQVNQNIKNYDGNVLRVKANNPLLLQQIDTDSQPLLKTIAQYETILGSDIANLEAATAEDATTIKGSVQTTRFEGRDMSHLLLARMHADYVNQAMNMFRWLKHNIPEPEVDFVPHNQRGVDVHFAGAKRTPRIIAKSIELSGENRIFDQHYNFAGKAFNLSSDPSLMSEPTRIELRAQGPQHLIVTAEFDRSSPEPIDTLKVICPELKLTGRTLGDANSLQVTLGDQGRMQVEIEVRTVGDQLSGLMTLRHSDVSLHVDKLSDLAGGESTAIQMNEGGLGLINEFVSKIKLSGTVDNFQFEASSDLGDQFSLAVNSILQEKKNLAIARRTKRLMDTKRLQIQSINDTIVQRLNQLRGTLQQNTVRVSELKRHQPNQSRLNPYY